MQKTFIPYNEFTDRVLEVISTVPNVTIGKITTILGAGALRIERAIEVLIRKGKVVEERFGRRFFYRRIN